MVYQSFNNLLYNYAMHAHSKYFNQRCDNSLELPETTENVDCIVVIPAYKEDYEILMNVYRSLINQLNPPQNKFVVLTLINYKANDSATLKSESNRLFDQLQATDELSNCSSVKFHFYCSELTGKKAGVGMARKQLMDLAYRWYVHIKKNGIIINLDADTEVDSNYTNAILKFFQKSKNEAASIAFAHNLNAGINDEAIIQYELHLRYFINIQRMIGFPFAYQTVGSAMAVTAEAYAKEGGMSLKQAGEDFYFLHKYSKKLSLGEINQTTVFPSSRRSDRVPFGTGKAVNDILDSQAILRTYNFTSFFILGEWLAKNFKALLEDFKNPAFVIGNPTNFDDFLASINFKAKVKKLKGNSIDYQSFIKSFFRWFDAFTLMKYLHFMREKKSYADISINEAIIFLFEALGLKIHEKSKENLKTLRTFDLKTDYENQWRAALISSDSNISAS